MDAKSLYRCDARSLEIHRQVADPTTLGDPPGIGVRIGHHDGFGKFMNFESSLEHDQVLLHFFWRQS